MKILFLSIALLMACCPFVLAQAKTTFDAANEAYKQSDYSASIKGYEEILEEGFYAEELYFNLANSYYKKQQLGKAILNYERALLLDPYDENTRFNLAVAQQKIQGEEIDPVPPFFLLSWWRACRNTFSRNTWGVLAILLFWAGIAGLSIWKLGDNRALKKRGFLAGVVLLMLTVLPLSLAWDAHQRQLNSHEGILIVSTAALKSGADEGSQEIRSIYEGTRLELIDQINIWYKVRLENGETGWLAGNTFEEI